MVTLESVSKNPHQVPPTNSPTSRFVININFVVADCSTMKRYKTNVVVDQRPRGLNALLALGEKLHHLALVAFPKLPPTAPPPPHQHNAHVVIPSTSQPQGQTLP